MQTPKRKRYQKDSAPVDDILTLIQLVRENPAIYNYKLQPHRRRVDVLSGWAQIAAQIGNKYTVEECRRKWKNLRDTYHQYRLRKSKPGDGLSKWRYAKDLEFLSTVYQPKLKSERKQNVDNVDKSQMLQGTTAVYSDTATQNSDEILGGSEITLVNHDAETFILTAYEESVNDDVTIDQHHHHHHHNQNHYVHQDEDIEHAGHHVIKHEHATLEDMVDDGTATGTEVDYEEVCLYEEATNAQTNDCETIINSNGGGGGSNSSCMPHHHDSRDTKEYHYIDANDFCIDAINAHTQLHNCSSGGNSSSGGATLNGGINGGGANSTKLKNIMSVISATESNEITTITATENMECIPTSLIQLQAPLNNTNGSTPSQPTSVASVSNNEHVREELDLFFDFLKKKIQHFSKEEISAIQIDILNCVLRAESAQKFSSPGGSRS